MLTIHPEQCIDCGVCVPECPIEAIQPDTAPNMETWVELNAKYSKEWPNIRVAKVPPKDADEWAKVPDKYPKYFSPNKGE